MVSNLSLCVSTGLLLCQPSVVSEDVAQQKHYSQVEESEIQEIVSSMFIPSTYVRDLPSLESMEYIIGYYEYAEEQERLEQERIAEEQRRLEQEQRRLEEERKHQEWLNSFDRKDYRQTYYSVAEGETELGSGYYYGHQDVKNIDNVMYFNDSEYGWLPIVAIDMDEVTASDQNSQGIWNIYGSVIEMKRENTVWKAIILDACGACRYANKVDLWVYNNQPSLDVIGIDWRYIRNGWN